MSFEGHSHSSRKRWVDVCLALALVGTAWHVSTLWSASGRQATEDEALPPMMNVGVPVSVPGLWAPGDFERTVVLMLDVDCPSCLLSRPFYMQLGRFVAGVPRARFVVLTEDRVEVARKWLSEGGVQAEVVRIASRRQLGIVSTPTLLLADSSGVVTDMVRGLLGIAEAERFKDRLRGDPDVEPLQLPFTITEVSVREHPEIEAASLQLIDVRPIDAFAREHALSAVNIPAQDLARAAREFRQSMPIAVECRYSEQAMCRVIAVALGDMGFVNVVVILQ